MYRFLLLCLLFPNILLFAQPPQKQKLERRLEQLRKAMIDANEDKLSKLVSDQLSYGHSSGHIDDKKEFIEKLTSGRSDFVRMDISEQQITLSGKTAIVRHILQGDILDGGKPGKVSLYVLQIWQRTHGEWILLARQAAKRN